MLFIKLIQKWLESSIAFLTNFTPTCLYQAFHAEELSEVNNKLQAIQEDNKMSQEKLEALERDLSSAEDEVISLTRNLENVANEKNELEKKEEQLRKELEEQG